MLNIFLFVLSGAYGVVLRCRHKVTDIFSDIKIDNLHMAKKSNIYGSSRKVNKRVDDYFVQRPKTHGLSRREIGNAY